MSTKRSLGMKKFVTEDTIHVYQNLLDGCYYIETSDSCLKVPKGFAEAVSKVIK